MPQNNKQRSEKINISSTIFRNYDIRGVADEDPLEPHIKRVIDLSPKHAWLIGKAFGTWLSQKNGKKIVVARDNRRTSFDLASGFVTGALSTGCEVMDIGLSTAPLIYFAVNELGCDGGLIVTGSHNPMWSNGLKLSKSGYNTLVGEEIFELYKIIQSEQFIIGKGSYSEASVTEVYIDEILKRVKPAARNVKVVVDPGNATGGLFGPKVLERLGYNVIPINADVIYPFPKGAPDPEQPGKLQELGQKVKELGADVGIAYDGDADRVGVVTENGDKIESDLVVLLLSRAVIEENPGAEIVFDVKCSDVLISDIQKRGGVPVMWKTGHSNIKQKMSDDSAQGKPALLGGELSGHIFFRDRFFGFDDAIYASCRILEIISRSDKKVSTMLDDLPKLKTTRELALPCPDDKKPGVIEQLTTKFKSQGFNVIDIDGVRISFGLHKWALVRISNTQPKLTARFQATTGKDLRDIVRLIKNELSNYSYVETGDLDKGLDEALI